MPGKRNLGRGSIYPHAPSTPMPRMRRDPDLRQRSRFPAGEAAQQPLPEMRGVSSGGASATGAKRKSSSGGEHGEKSFGGFFSDAGCPAVGICGADLSGEDCRRKKLGPTVERVAAGPHWEGLFLQRTTSALWRVGGAPPFWTFGTGKLNGDYLSVSVATTTLFPSSVGTMLQYFSAASLGVRSM
jgi:hypothetical protein